MGRRSSGKRKESRKDEQAETKRKVEDEAEKQEMVISLTDQAWMRVENDDDNFMPSGNSSSSCTMGSALAPKVVSDELMLKIQQAFDAVNNSQNSLRSVVLNLRGKVDMAILSGGMEKVSLAQGCLGQLEAALLTPKEELNEGELRKMLIEIARTYQGVRLKELEISSLNKTFSKAAVSSSASAPSMATSSGSASC